MLSFFTFFVTDDLPARREPGDIVIRNCTVTGADRFLHINLSGNEPWQRGNPPTEITFENIRAKDIKTGLYAYGNGVVPYRLNLKNINYSVAPGYEQEPFMKVAHFGEINFQNVQIENYRGNAFIKTWSEGGAVNMDVPPCPIQENELLVKAEKPFTCDPI